MLRKERQAVQVFRRVRDFLKDNPPQVSFGDLKPIVDQLEAVIGQVETFAQDQQARGQQAATGTRRAQRAARALRMQFLFPIVRASKLLFPTDPDLLATFEMPEGRDYVTVMTAAEAMATSAEPHREQFITTGLPVDFIDRVRKAADTLRVRIDARAVDLGKRSASTSGLRLTYQRGREIVRMLNAMVDPALEGSVRQADWRTIARFARVTPLAADPLPEDEPTGGSGTTPAQVAA